LVSRAFHGVARSTALPQARRAIVRCQMHRNRPGRINNSIRDLPDLLETLEDWQARGVFALPRVELVLTEHGGMRSVPESNLSKSMVALARGSTAEEWSPLPTVSSLDLSVSPADPKTRRQLPAVLLKVLSKRLPQLEVLRMDHVMSSIAQSVEVAFKACRTLHTFSWRSPPPRIFFLSGQNFKYAVALRHLRLDDADFYEPTGLAFNADGWMEAHGAQGEETWGATAAAAAVAQGGVPIAHAFFHMKHLSLQTLSLINASVQGTRLPAEALLPLVTDLWPTSLRALRVDEISISGTIGDRIRAARPDVTLVPPRDEL